MDDLKAKLDEIERFARESNRIEGYETASEEVVQAHRDFLDRALCVPSLIEFVSVCQPDARFRNQPHISGVRVADHIAPPSGPEIEDRLRDILAIRNPWEQHCAYETLHPFTDGNGRSGRVLWLHRHIHERLDQWAVRRGFLHSWYYHTLQNYGGRHD